MQYLIWKIRFPGSLNINGKKIDFNKGVGYIEKDWGISFPKDYIWCQGNNFNNSNSSFMISVADIPFKVFNFKGLICDLIVNDKEYKFATYNNSKLIKCDINGNDFDITLKKDNYYLEVCSIYNNGSKLYAPVKGKMDKDIIESISSTIRVTLKENEKIIFSDISKNCGIEIVQ